MNKRVINEAVTYAYEAIKECNLLEKNGHLDKKYRSQISSFGAAITMGSLLPAVAFFSDKGSAEVDRQKLMDAVLFVLKKQGKCDENISHLYDYIQAESNDTQAILKENIINASISVKLAMNLYTFDVEKEE